MTRKLLIALGIIGALSSCVASDVLPTRNIPVEINAEALDITQYLRPFGGEEKSGEFKKMLEAKWIDTYPVTSIDTSRKRQVGSCAEYEEAPLPNWEPSIPSDFASYQLMATKCKLIALLAKAKPSKISFIKEVKVDGNFIRNLPKRLAYMTSTSEFEKMLAQTSTSKLGEVSRVLEVIPKEHKTVEVMVPGGMQTITVAATGDFNQDSVDDMLLLISNSSLDGTYSTSNAVVITRRGKDEIFQVVVP